MTTTFVVSWPEQKIVRTSIDATDKQDAMQQFNKLHPDVEPLTIEKGILKEYKK